MHRQQPSAALPLSTRAVTSPEPDVLVAHLAIRRAGDLIGRPVVHDGLARFLSSRHDRVQCVPHVLLFLLWLWVLVSGSREIFRFAAFPSSAGGGRMFGDIRIRARESHSTTRELGVFRF